jgi:hypothetical protein
MGVVLVFLGRLGVPERFRRAAAIALAVVALVALLATLKGCYDRSVVNQHEAEREAKATDARETAAAERLDDAATNAKSEQEMHDAIDNAPKGGQLSPAAHALACKRLRDLGRVPASCRPAGGN